jgi:hypothetical protein
VVATGELFIAIPGCLNPRPEELPSHEDLPTEPEPARSVERESCEDNPLLAGCSLPDQDINANPISPPAAEPAPESVTDTLDISAAPADADAGSSIDAGASSGE